MSSVSIVFPHQLFEKGKLLDQGLPVYLVEEYLFFRQYGFHQQKLAFHRSSMKFYATYLQNQGIDVHYVDSTAASSDIRNLLEQLAAQGITDIHTYQPVDDWLGKRILQRCQKLGMNCHQWEHPLFLNQLEELQSFFSSDKKKYFQTEFYIQQRKQRQVLVDPQNKPQGGKWSFDQENRKKYPRHKKAPAIEFPPANEFHSEALEYVSNHYSSNPGTLTDTPLYPTTFADARKWFDDFLAFRFQEFGDYEDAIVSEESILHHSVLTPMLNVGLLTPQYVVDHALKSAVQHEIPINSCEGFIRQIMGWREFIRGLYEYHGVSQRTRNFWGFSRKIPDSFYNGTTGIEPLDVTIKKVLETGYCHHIERLMVLGNFMLLCEFHPDEVYRWFMELFIDAYDWVMVPNVYGMSQFADGGFMATKPYISGSNYLKKMSNYSKGPWQEVWDALFWRFMHVHRDFFLSNPRLGMLVRTFDKMQPEKQQRHLQVAQDYLSSLN